MLPCERLQSITDRLQQKFNPDSLEVIDDSADHIGHAGSRDGAGHYTVIIKVESLKKLDRIAAHRAVYAELADLIPKEIHALKINIK